MKYVDWQNACVNLFTTMYTDKVPERDDELLTCIRLNCQVETIDRVFILEEPPYRIEDNDKIKVVRVNARATFDDVFAVVRRFAGKKDLNIVANTDIHLSEEGVRRVQKYLRSHECYALSRWDVDPRSGFAKLNWGSMTQDVWAFRGHPRQLNGSFYMGKLGCDCRLAWELLNAGYVVKNPCRDIRAYHLHASQVRNYDATSADTVPGPHRGVPQQSIRFLPWASWSLQRALRKVLQIGGIHVRFPYEVEQRSKWQYSKGRGSSIA